MRDKHIDTLIRALVKEPEQAQRESLGEVLREALILKRTLRRALARQTTPPLARAEHKRRSAGRPQTKDTHPQMTAAIVDLKKLGCTLREISEELTARGYTTSKGKPISHVQVSRVLKSLEGTADHVGTKVVARDWFDMFNQPSMSQGLQPLEEESPLDESAPDLSYSTRTEEEIRRDGFKLGHRFERELFEFLGSVLSFCEVDQVSQNTQGKLKTYCDIRVVKLEFKPELFGTNARVLIEAKSHKSEVIKPLDEIPRLPYQISELQKEVSGGDTRAFVVCGRYVLLAPEMLEFETVLPHYTLDIYEIDPVEGAILTDLDLDGLVKAIQSNPQEQAPVHARSLQ